MIDLQDVNVGNPFPGLRPFETDEYHLFFGREGQSDELIKRLSATRFLAVVGTSGSGKSSLIRAGLLPALHGGLMPGAGSSWRVALMRPGHDPIGNLAHELGAILDESRADAEIQNALIETTLRRSTLGLVDAVRQARMSPHEKLLVVVDQFEELFRFKEARKETDLEDDALVFVKLLIEASAQVEVPIYVVLTMRSDFLGDCSQFAGLPEAINQGQYLIPRMSRDERRAAITGPVAVGGGEMTVPLINRLLNDVGDNPDQLPILQHALMRTWDYSVAHRRNGEAIGLEHYEAIGSMAEALSRHADEAFHELPNERSRLIAEKIFKALTEQGATNRETRRPVPLHQLCSIAGATESEVVAVIETFRREGRSFLMPPAGTPLEPDTIIDISHESLIRNWERLHEWVIEEARSAQIYRRLAEAAVLYQRKEEGLLSGPFLQIALEWREKQRPNRVWAYRYNPEFNTADRFLDASRDDRDAKLAAQERELQEKRDSESRELKQAAALAEKEKRLAEAEKQRAEEQAAAREREFKQAQAFAEAEKQRAAEQAAARERELEQAQAFAREQTKAATRLKRLTFALVLISLLAVGAALGAGYAYAQAKKSELKATRASDEAKSSLVAETKAKIDADNQRGFAESQQKIAVQRATEAEEAKRDAQVAQSRAEQAAKDARSAAAREAKVAQVARDAESAARATAAKLQAATDRNRWSRDGLAAFQRGDYEEALNAFHIVRDNTRLEADRSGKIVDAEMARIDGWTLANIGAAQREMGQPLKAVESYEKALGILEDTLDPDDPVRFDTYDGLAHAYRDAHQVSKAEEYYKLALEFLENNSVGKQSRVADELEHLARLYRNFSRHAEAEPLYRRIISIRKDAANTQKAAIPELVATLTEVAQFYAAQNKYKEAEAFYPEILAIQEEKLFEGIDIDKVGKPEALENLAESYSNLGAIYIGMGDEQKGRHGFQFARSLQDFWAKMRQFLVKGDIFSSDSDKELEALGLEKDMQQMAESLIILGRYGAAERIHQAILDEQKETVRAAVTHLSLGDLYSIHLKNYDKAEQSYKAAVEFLEKDNTKTSELYIALDRLGGLYANQMNKPAQAEESFKRALNLPKVGPFHQYKLFSGLAELYKQQKRELDLEDVYVRRLTVAEKMVDRWYSPDLTASNRAAKLYLQAASDLAKFYEARRQKVAAVSTYQRVFKRNATLLEMMLDTASFGDYAATLDKYLLLLRDLNTPAEAAKVEQAIVYLRARQKQLEPRQPGANPEEGVKP